MCGRWQNCAPNGPGQWVFRETVARIIELLEMQEPELIYKEDEMAGVVSPKYKYVTRNE